jgi:hypothetical protein
MGSLPESIHLTPTPARKFPVGRWIIHIRELGLIICSPYPVDIDRAGGSKTATERSLKRKNESFGGSHAFVDLIPSLTATSACCPQCAAVMNIRMVEPDLKDPPKARHVFECQECGLSRAYLIDR